MAGVGGRSGPAVPLERRAAPDGAPSPWRWGVGPRAKTEWRSCAQRSLRPDAAGLEGSDAHTRQFECRRHNAIALVRCPYPRSAQRCRAPQEPDQAHSRIRSTAAAACARACGPAAAAALGRIEGVTRNQGRCDPWRLRKSPPVHAQLIPAFCIGRPSRPSRQSIVIRGDRDAYAARRRASGVERGHDEGVRRPDTEQMITGNGNRALMS